MSLRSSGYGLVNAIHGMVGASDSWNESLVWSVVQIFCLLAHSVGAVVLQTTLNAPQAWSFIACNGSVSVGLGSARLELLQKGYIPHVR